MGRSPTRPTPGSSVRITSTYVADNGAWSGNPDIPLSPPSEPATVTITVTNDAPTCNVELTATVLPGSSTLLTNNCSDVNGDALLVTSVGPVSGGGTAAVTNPLSASLTFTAPSNATTATFSYTVSDGKGGTANGNARITVSPPPRYGFKNVQNLPPSNETSRSRPARRFRCSWQWLMPQACPVNTAGQAIVKALLVLPGRGDSPRVLIGQFIIAEPGQRQLVPVRCNDEHLELQLEARHADGGIIKNLPVGTYVVQVINSVTEQIDPEHQQLHVRDQTGAVIKVVKQ